MPELTIRFVDLSFVLSELFWLASKASNKHCTHHTHYFGTAFKNSRLSFVELFDSYLSKLTHCHLTNSVACLNDGWLVVWLSQRFGLPQSKRVHQGPKSRNPQNKSHSSIYNVLLMFYGLIWLHQDAMRTGLDTSNARSTLTNLQKIPGTRIRARHLQFCHLVSQNTSLFWMHDYLATLLQSHTLLF